MEGGVPFDLTSNSIRDHVDLNEFYFEESVCETNGCVSLVAHDIVDLIKAAVELGK